MVREADNAHSSEFESHTVQHCEAPNLVDEYLLDLQVRLGKRAEIRRQIKTRKSVLEGKPDRLSDLLEEAAHAIHSLRCRNNNP